MGWEPCVRFDSVRYAGLTGDLLVFRFLERPYNPDCPVPGRCIIALHGDEDLRCHQCARITFVFPSVKGAMDCAVVYYDGDREVSRSGCKDSLVQE